MNRTAVWWSSVGLVAIALGVSFALFDRDLQRWWQPEASSSRRPHPRPDTESRAPLAVEALVVHDPPLPESVPRSDSELVVITLDADRRPIEGAWVRVGTLDEVDAFDTLSSGRDAKHSSAEGKTTWSSKLPLQGTWIAASAEGFFPALTHAGNALSIAGDMPSESRVVEVVLSAPQRLVIQVVDTDQGPLSAARVRARAIWSEEAAARGENSIAAARLCPTGVTQVDGRCDLALAVEEEYRLEVACPGHIPFQGAIDAAARSAGTVRVTLDQVFVAGLRVVGMRDPRRVNITTADFASSQWSSQLFVDEVWSASVEMQRRFGIPEQHCFVAAGDPARLESIDDGVTLLAYGQRRTARLRYRPLSRFVESDLVIVEFASPEEPLGEVVATVVGTEGTPVRSAFDWTLVRMDDHVHPRLDPTPRSESDEVAWLDVSPGEWSLAIGRPRFMDGYVEERPRFALGPGERIEVTVKEPSVELVHPSLDVFDASGRRFTSYRATLFDPFTGFIPLRNAVGVPIGVYDLTVEVDRHEKVTLQVDLGSDNDRGPIRVPIRAAAAMVAGADRTESSPGSK